MNRNLFLSPTNKINTLHHQEFQQSTNRLNRYLSYDQLKTPSEKIHQPLLLKKIQNYSFSTNQCIGQGYSSKVFKAKKQGSTQIFAIKVIDLKKYPFSQRHMLETQTNILKSLNHHNIIKCYDVFWTINNCYIITQYCEQGDLANILKKEKLKDSKFYNKILKDILQGFVYLAQLGIVHRDIKPANIFKKGNSYKLADFGFAKKMNDIECKQNYNVGTPLYMPPESLVKNKYSIKSDIFSIGALFFQIVMGSTPWNSHSEKNLVERMLKDPLKFEKSVEISKDLKQFIQGCLIIDPQKRFNLEGLINSKLYNRLVRNHQQPVNQKKQLDIEKISINQIKAQISQRIDLRAHYKNNTEILVCQLNFCRFMYYLIVNNIPNDRSKNIKQSINFILYKHIFKIVQRLTNKNNNLYHLFQYDNYKYSTEYNKLYNTIMQYKVKYEVSYNKFIKQIKPQTNQMLHQQLFFFENYDQNRNLDEQYLKFIRKQIRVYMRSLYENIDFQIKQDNDNKELNSKIKTSIQILKSLLKYFKLIEIQLVHFNDFQYFRNQSKIQVIRNYSINDCTYQSFVRLRQIIPLIVSQ